MNRRRRRRRFADRIPAVVVTLILLLLIGVLLDRFVFVVRDVRVTCDGEADEAYVIRSSGIGMGRSLRKLDTASMEQSLLRTGRYILLEVNRRLPNHVELVVGVRTPAMTTEFGGHAVILDEDMIVISLGEEEPPELLRLRGTEAQTAAAGRVLGTTPARVGAASAICSALAENAVTDRIIEVDLTDPDALSLYTDRGVTVELGTSDLMERKIAWMKYALKDLADRGETGGRLDVSTGKQADYRPD